MANGVIRLNHTVRAAGRDVRVAITYEKDGGYFVFTAPLYKLKIARPSRTDAWKDFSEKLAEIVRKDRDARP